MSFKKNNDLFPNRKKKKKKENIQVVAMKQKGQYIPNEELPDLARLESMNQK